VRADNLWKVFRANSLVVRQNQNRVSTTEPRLIEPRPACAAAAPPLVNVAARLVASAQAMPDALAVIMPRRRARGGRRVYDRVTFREFDRDSDRLARGLRELGVRPGTRLALLVKPSIDFIALVFALLKSGAVAILIDPGMGRKHLLRCLDEVRPEGFVAIPLVQAVRAMSGRRYRRAVFNVTVGRRLFWGGLSIDELRGRDWTGPEMAATSAEDPAAIIFTSGSTGPPKGVLYRHGNFDRQVTEIRDFYGIQPGEIDLPCFPLFGLFNCAMGVTTVIPAMDASRPARANPAHLVEAIHDWNVTQAFGSPAVWNRVGAYCAKNQVRLPTLRRVLSAGAAVPPAVLSSMAACIQMEGEVHTPYGATEALPVASISSREVLGETAAQSRLGAGTCVGRRFPGIEWKVIRAATHPQETAIPTPLAGLAEVEELLLGEIGELIVRGPVVTSGYVTRTEWNALAKIPDDPTAWHRTGDVGYLDAAGRFWFCGRMAHRVVTASGTLYTEPCEAIFNQHAALDRSALVGVGPGGQKRPAVVCQPKPDKWPRGLRARKDLVAELRDLARQHPITAAIADFLFHRALPVDVRHNAKISREKLAVWAARRIAPRSNR
jgi:olefin beta-lactone synthetase